MKSKLLLIYGIVFLLLCYWAKQGNAQPSSYKPHSVHILDLRIEDGLAISQINKIKLDAKSAINNWLAGSSQSCLKPTPEALAPQLKRIIEDFTRRLNGGAPADTARAKGQQAGIEYIRKNSKVDYYIDIEIRKRSLVLTPNNSVPDLIIYTSLISAARFSSTAASAKIDVYEAHLIQGRTDDHMVKLIQMLLKDWAAQDSICVYPADEAGKIEGNAQTSQEDDTQEKQKSDLTAPPDTSAAISTEKDEETGELLGPVFAETHPWQSRVPIWYPIRRKRWQQAILQSAILVTGYVGMHYFNGKRDNTIEDRNLLLVSQHGPLNEDIKRYDRYGKAFLGLGITFTIGLNLRDVSKNR